MNYVTEVVGINAKLEMDFVRDTIEPEQITPDQRIITILN